MEGDEKCQLVLPQQFREQAMRGIHDAVGHMRRDKVSSLAQERVFWPIIARDLGEWLKRCVCCIMRKSTTTQNAPLVNISTTQPLELVCTDFLTLETYTVGYQHILVMTDHFTRFAQAIPTRQHDCSHYS